MSGGFEANPEAIGALTTAFAEAQQQTDQVKAALEKPQAEQKDFGRSWQDPLGRDFVDSMGAIAADLANLSKLFADVQAQLGQMSNMMVAGETTQVGVFQEIGSDSGSDSGSDGGSTSGGI
ncbi:hypothetical protein [Actinophytocola sp.]|uniref:hypothetical protein n=1 Tax=Actinophytocola sp. TaxID=1872138 RepID=UPI00389A14D7